MDFLGNVKRDLRKWNVNKLAGKSIVIYKYWMDFMEIKWYIHFMGKMSKEEFLNYEIKCFDIFILQIHIHVLNKYVIYLKTVPSVPYKFLFEFI